MKKPASSVRFRFYKQKTEKTESNRTETDKKPEKTEPNQKNRAKTKKTEPNRFEPVFAIKKPNRNRSVWPGFGSVSVFFSKKKKISVWLLLLIKTEPNRKWSPLVIIIISQFSILFIIYLSTIYLFNWFNEVWQVYLQII